MPKTWPHTVLLVLAVVCSGCGHAPPRLGSPVVPLPTITDNSLAAEIAASMVGKPYRFGGSAPGDGFDCSGLVHYAYAVAGIDLPRTATDLSNATQAVPPQDAAVGDLLFFGRDGAIDHVGIYYGDGQFVHAPGRGKAVTLSRLADIYWRPRLVRVGRPLPHLTTALAPAPATGRAY